MSEERTTNGQGEAEAGVPGAGLARNPRAATVLEPPIFTKGGAGLSGLDVAGVATADAGSAGTDEADLPLAPELLRERLEDFPEVSEPEVLRHYVRLSQLNYSAATNFYPLGSCTMKYNPVLDEQLAGWPGFAEIHPYAPESTVQGALELLAELEHCLAEVAGLAEVSLQPAAGAQGELTGMKILRAWLADRGEDRRTVLIPESAHGTNPASAALSGFAAVTVPCDERGLLSAAAVAERLGPDTAALMVTNPNTLGLFEEDIVDIARLVHEAGGLVYMDGANMNALMGVAKPGHMGADILQFNLHKTFSTPHGGGGPGAGPVAVRADLEPYLPGPRLRRNEPAKAGGRASWSWDFDRPKSVGRVRSFYGNFGVLVRAYAYILACGGDGLTDTTRYAVLAANYVRARLAGAYHLPYATPSMHEVVFTDKLQNAHGAKTLDIAKRLLDYGFHAPTIYFPLVVAGALMIEPTESESQATIDRFCEAMLAIAREIEADADFVQGAPYTTPLARLDETLAARRPVLTWTRPES